MSEGKKNVLLSEGLIIIAITFIAEIIGRFIHYPTPIVGLILLLLLFIFGVLKPSQIEKTGNSLLSNIGIMFVPHGLGLVTILGLVADNAFSLITTIFVSTIVILVVTGWISQFLLERLGKKEK